MNQTDQAIGDAKVLGPDEGEFFWQPLPATGYIRNIFSSKNVKASQELAIGTQTLPPGRLIREHAHDRSDEVILVIAGKGFIKIDGEEHALQVGSAVFLGKNRRHTFINPGPDALTFVWVFVPGGLDLFFERVGRPKLQGEAAPDPFPFPENIKEIEKVSVGWGERKYDKVLD